VRRVCPIRRRMRYDRFHGVGEVGEMMPMELAKVLKIRSRLFWMNERVFSSNR